jgi:uncharacterized protein YgiM (DUF1202 family)
MCKTFLTVAALLLVFAISTAVAEDKRWVSSDGTTLKRDASVSAEDLGALPIGTELMVLEAGGRWVRVKLADGREGWVYAGRIADTPPSAEVTGEAGLFGGVLQGSQIQSAKSDSARSIRGLSPETAQYARQRGTPEIYRRELDRVLARKVSARELKAFLREGRIGEYAE